MGVKAAGTLTIVLLALTCQPIETDVGGGGGPLASTAGLGTPQIEESPAPEVPECRCRITGLSTPVRLAYRPLTPRDYTLQEALVAADDPDTVLLNYRLEGQIGIDPIGDQLVLRFRYGDNLIAVDGSRQSQRGVDVRLLLTTRGDILDAAVSDANGPVTVNEDLARSARAYYLTFIGTYAPAGYVTGDRFPIAPSRPGPVTSAGSGFTVTGESTVLDTTEVGGPGLVVRTSARFSSSTGRGTSRGFFIVDLNSGLVRRWSLLSVETPTDQPTTTYYTRSTLLGG
jgi:hypothetical protein